MLARRASFWVGDSALFSFRPKIGLRCGVRGDGFSSNFRARIGEERGLDILSMELEGGEGANGSSDTGCSFRGAIGEMFGLLRVQ